jgi:hypothetical protein
MSVQRDLFQELLHRVTALEHQMVSLRDWLKPDDEPQPDENFGSLERVPSVERLEFMPLAGGSETRPMIREMERFRRRGLREGSLKF